MIIEKFYNFDEIPKSDWEFPITLREHQRKIQTDIIKQTNQILIKGQFDPVVFVGIEAFIMLLDQTGFLENSVNKDIINIYTEYVGLLVGRKVYYDNRLKSNKVIVGGNFREIDAHIRTRGRKEKLLKLNELQIH